MRPQGPTSWLLDGHTSWPTAYREYVSAGEAGIGLAANPRGPLSFGAPDGSLGALVLPAGMALDPRGILYVLDRDEALIRRFDPASRSFVPLPSVGEEGSEARQFRRPANIAIAGPNLYVSDAGNDRVQVFHLPTLALLYVWKFREVGGQPWEPLEVAAASGLAYVLDRRFGRVYRHLPGTDTLELALSAASATHWTRLAIDRIGNFYLFDSEKVVLDVYSKDGAYLCQAREPDDVRQRFDAPVIRMDYRGRFCLPESLAGECPRGPASWPAADLHRPLAPCLTKPPGGLIFNSKGEPIKVNPEEEKPGPAIYETRGAWASLALDSNLYRCQWHRIEMELSDLPPGTQVTVSTHASDKEDSKDFYQLEQLWDTRYTATGPMQPQDGEQRGGSHEFLVQSREGQYLWLRVQMRGDGYATPRVKSIRVHYPRDSYLQYLPAVYSEDYEGRWFLDRFLSIFQTEWDNLESTLEEMALYFDPEAVPGKFMGYLANWLGLPLEGTWNAEQKRRLLAAAPRFGEKRGTLDSLRYYLQIYLQNITGLGPEDQCEYPQIVEGFRERQHLMLSIDNFAALGHGPPLWSKDIAGRLQLDVFNREGEVRLVSTGDPQRDFFHEYAHKFRVYVPSAWVQSAQDENLLRRAIDEEKPAHTFYDLCLVEPRLTVGIQSTVGIDTIIGDHASIYLTCPEMDKDAPPSRSPDARLGHDTFLGGRPGESTEAWTTLVFSVGHNTILK